MGRLLIGCAAAVAGCLLALPALAQGDDHAAAQAIVDEVGRDTAHGEITREALGLARQELERAARLRVVYDEKRARAADGAAREWAEMARDLLRAVDAEAKASEVRRKALEKQEQVDRTRALVDEDIARIGRLKAELEAAEKAAKHDDGSARRAVEVHEGDPRDPRDPPPAKKATKKAAPAKPAPAPAKPPADATGGAP
jgi:hypothetical protein